MNERHHQIECANPQTGEMEVQAVMVARPETGFTQETALTAGEAIYHISICARNHDNLCRIRDTSDGSIITEYPRARTGTLYGRLHR